MAPIVRLVEAAFGHVGLDWSTHVRTDPALLRPAEVDHLIGDASKSKRVLGWEPSVSFEQLVAMMVDADIAALSDGTRSKTPPWIPREPSELVAPPYNARACGAAPSTRLGSFGPSTSPVRGRS